MIKILIMCVGGSTTSMIAKRTTDAIKKQGLANEYKIDALGFEQGAKQAAANYDVLLCGPHVTFLMKEFEGVYPDKVIAAVPVATFGRMDGDGIIKLVQEEVKKKGLKK